MTPLASALGKSPEKQVTLTHDAADFHRAMLDFVRIYQLRDRDRTELHNVSASAAHILEVLTRLGQSRSISLPPSFSWEKSTASRVVTGLVEKGYVWRVTDPDDRRALRLEVTPTGSELHERINAHALQDTSRCSGCFRQVHAGG